MTEKAQAAGREREPRILILDIETFPMELLGYGLYDQSFGVKQIQQDMTIASFAANWYGSKEIIYHDVSGNRDKRCDKALAKKLHALMKSADVVLGQNSKSYDVRVINERFLRHGLGPAPEFKQIDTKKLGKKHFFFPSYSLEYMSTRYCKTKKMTDRRFHGIELQKECLKGNKAAWKEMRLYNIADVIATRELYERLAPWGIGVNLNIFRGESLFRCQCGSMNLQKRGYNFAASGKFRRFQCVDCGAWSSEKGRENNLMPESKKVSLRGTWRGKKD